VIALGASRARENNSTANVAALTTSQPVTASDDEMYEGWDPTPKPAAALAPPVADAAAAGAGVPGGDAVDDAGEAGEDFNNMQLEQPKRERNNMAGDAGEHGYLNGTDERIFDLSADDVILGKNVAHYLVKLDDGTVHRAGTHSFRAYLKEKEEREAAAKAAKEQRVEQLEEEVFDKVQAAKDEL